MDTSYVVRWLKDRRSTWPINCVLWIRCIKSVFLVKNNLAHLFLCMEWWIIDDQCSKMQSAQGIYEDQEKIRGIYKKGEWWRGFFCGVDCWATSFSMPRSETLVKYTEGASPSLFLSCVRGKKIMSVAWGGALVLHSAALLKTHIWTPSWRRRRRKKVDCCPLLW